MNEVSRRRQRLVDAVIVTIVEVSVWYFLPPLLDLIASTQIRLDQQIAAAIIVLLLAYSVYLFRRNQVLYQEYQTAGRLNEVVYDYEVIHNEKKVLSQDGSRKIVWKQGLSETRLLKIRVDAFPAADVSVRTICLDLVVHDLKFNVKTSHEDAYEVIPESRVQIWESEVRMAPGKWFVIVSLPQGETESTAYLEISERRAFRVPSAKRRTPDS